MDAEVTIYEFYDGYEHLWENENEEDRERVRYFVVGRNDPYVVICYVGELNHIAQIGSRTHERAWIVGTIPIKEAFLCISKTKLPSTESLEQRIAQLQAAKEEADRRNNMLIGHSASMGPLECGSSIHWKAGESFTDKYVQELENKVRMLRTIGAFLA